PPRLFRHFRTGGTLHTEPLLYESGPLFIECWFMNGYRSHLLCRSVIRHDAKEKLGRWQVKRSLRSKVTRRIYGEFASLQQNVERRIAQQRRVIQGWFAACGASLLRNAILDNAWRVAIVSLPGGLRPELRRELRPVDRPGDCILQPASHISF